MHLCEEVGQAGIGSTDSGKRCVVVKQALGGRRKEAVVEMGGEGTAVGLGAHARRRKGDWGGFDGGTYLHWLSRQLRWWTAAVPSLSGITMQGYKK